MLLSGQSGQEVLDGTSVADSGSQEQAQRGGRGGDPTWATGHFPTAVRPDVTFPYELSARYLRHLGICRKTGVGSPSSIPKPFSSAWSQSAKSRRGLKSCLFRGGGRRC